MPVGGSPLATHWGVHEKGASRWSELREKGEGHDTDGNGLGGQEACDMTLWVVLATAATLGLTLALPSEVGAATIYGMLEEAGRPLAGLQIDLQCEGGRDSTQTDARGTYRFTVGWTGRCELRARGDSSTVILYNEPTRYDFEIRQVDGRPRLIRR